MPNFVAAGATVQYTALGGAAEADSTALIWAHGWGQSGAAFLPLAQSLEKAGHHAVLDFPGFGASPRPPADWGTEDYADAMAEWLATQPKGKRIWIGHSFGCRVGLQLAARHPGLVDGLVLIAAAGLQRKRSVWQRLRMQTRIYAFKLAKALVGWGLPVEKWRDSFGSADYRSSGGMRAIFLKTIREDLTHVAPQVGCPVLLIYGANDDDTPPEIGERLARLIPKAELKIVDGLDHHTILTEGRHQVLFQLNRFLKALP